MRLSVALTVFGLVATLSLAGCTTTSTSTEEAKIENTKIFSDSYGAVNDAGYALPAIPINKLDKKFHRQIVSYSTTEKPGTIIVNTRERSCITSCPAARPFAMASA